MEKEPRTQADQRRDNFRRVADAANLLAEQALAEIDEALRVGEITQDQADVIAYSRLHADL